MQKNYKKGLFAWTARAFSMVLLFCVLTGLYPPDTGWTADVLDDSRSPRQTLAVQLNWAHQGDPSRLTPRELRQLTAVAPDVEVRLNTSRYVNQRVRIFLTLPSQITGLSGSDGFVLSWKTRGTLYNGAAEPGRRVLIYKGKLNTAELTEFFTFTLDVDASRLTGELRYAPRYEIEVF